jgi:CDP-paratose 2-epimerase
MKDLTLVTGGAGFVGTNMADRLIRNGEQVRLLDNLSRPGTEHNLEWLRDQYGSAVQAIEADVQDTAALRTALEGVTRVFHFAAQVAVTTSVTNPRQDFLVNLGGTLNLLEEMRRMSRPPKMLFTSTNKVYGALGDIAIEKTGGRYEPVDDTWREHGIGEDRSLSFCSPYGCSKGGADQYVLDYSATYGIPTVVFRMSCIYGPHQQGNEDQGWVAHFVKQAIARGPITLFGDGGQVRDILCVDDLIDAMLLALDLPDLGGQVFNIGGGPGNTTSLLELLDYVGELCGRAAEIETAPWRVGDQRWYVSDIARFNDATGWSPRVSIRQGVDQLFEWLALRASRDAVREAS